MQSCHSLCGDTPWSSPAYTRSQHCFHNTAMNSDCNILRTEGARRTRLIHTTALFNPSCPRPSLCTCPPPNDPNTASGSPWLGARELPTPPPLPPSTLARERSRPTRLPENGHLLMEDNWARRVPFGEQSGKCDLELARAQKGLICNDKTLANQAVITEHDSFEILVTMTGITVIEAVNNFQRYAHINVFLLQ